MEKYSIVFVMDKSGSMLNMGDEPWQSLNSFVKEQKSQNSNFTFTLCFFNDVTEFKYENIKSNEIIPLTGADYNPSGMTALYDAIGKTIEFQKEKTPNNKVIFVILTDGQENCSKEYNQFTIKTLISYMEEKYNWEFVFLANKLGLEEAKKCGIKNSCEFEYTPCGFNNIMSSVSSQVSKTICGFNSVENKKLT